MSVSTDSQYNSTSTVVVILKEAMHVNGCVSKRRMQDRKGSWYRMMGCGSYLRCGRKCVNCNTKQQIK